jgi:hypothetical protein
MFDSLRKLFKPAPAKPAESKVAFDAEKLRMLVEHFPIGRKLRYYPEYQHDIVFHTIVIAYRVNDQFIYARDAVMLRANGLPAGFILPDKTLLPLSKLRKFQMLLPDTTNMEGKLASFTRATLPPAGQFRSGNTVTLVAETQERGIPSLDTRVDRRQVLNDGPYADSPCVLVTPELDTLQVVDQRRKQRVQSEVRASLLFHAGAPAYRCLLADFSETTLRLAAEPGQVMPPLVAENHVIVEFDFGDVASSYRLRGKVFRREDSYCVVRFEDLYKDGEFERIKMMDVIEIKTCLINRLP